MQALSSCEAVLHPQAVTLYPPQAPLAAAAAATVDAASAAATTAAAATVTAAAATAAAATTPSAHIALPDEPRTEAARLSPPQPVSQATIVSSGLPAGTGGRPAGTAVTAAPVIAVRQAEKHVSPVIDAAAVRDAEADLALHTAVNMEGMTAPTLPDAQQLQPVATHPESQAGPSKERRPVPVAAAQMLPPCSSDSEGSLPDIDSGGSESEASSGE